jgi:hypothetical protein
MGSRSKTRDPCYIGASKAVLALFFIRLLVLLHSKAQATMVASSKLQSCVADGTVSASEFYYIIRIHECHKPIQFHVCVFLTDILQDQWLPYTRLQRP